MADDDDLVDLSECYSPEDVLTATLTIGGRGSGKTLSSVPKYVYVAERRDLAAILVEDRHGHLIRELIKHAYHRGFTGRLVIDVLADFRRVLPLATLKRSDDPRPDKRDAFDRVTVLTWMDLIWSMADRAANEEGSIHSKPAISRAFRHALGLLLYRERPVSPAELLSLCDPRSRACARLVESADTATQPGEAAQAFWKEVIQARGKALEELIGPYIRLVEQSLSPQFLARCAVESPILDLLLERKVVLLDASNDLSLHPRDAMGLFRAANMTAMNGLMSHYVKTRRPAPTIFVFEEAAASGQVSPWEINAIYREGRKAGAHPHALTQDLSFQDEEVMRAIIGNSPRQELFNPYDLELAKTFGPTFAYPQLDPDEIAHVHDTKRQVHAGFEIVRRKGTSVTYGPDGRQTKGENDTEVAVPKYDEIVERRVEHRSYNEQVMKKVGEILSTPRGCRWVFQADPHGVYVSKQPERAVLLPEPFLDEDGRPDEELAQRKIDRVIAQSQAQGCFIGPQKKEQPCPKRSEPAPPSAAPEAASPPASDPATRLRRRETRRSASG